MASKLSTRMHAAESRLAKPCHRCDGDGFFLIEPSDMRSDMDIANAKVRLSDGRSSPALGWMNPYLYAHVVAAGVEVPRIEAYEYECQRCLGSGVIRWGRGKSLPPFHR
jgi:hypothetical protein